MARDPLISVIMAVYNCEGTLTPAVNSIIGQTYTNWELVICDDASTDDTARILARLERELGPGQCKLLKNDVNRRLAFSLNRCLSVATGDYVARMDGDDISQPDRLARQMDYLVRHPEVHLLGTSMRRFSHAGEGEVIYPASPQPDRWTLGRSSKAPFFHATILARKELYERLGGYTVAWRTQRAEDLDLWFRFFAAGYVGRNVPDPLYLVREDGAAIRRRTPQSRLGDFLIRVRGSWMLRYPPQAYLRCVVNLLKVLLPYKVFDWHRAWTRRRTDRPAATR